MLNTDVKLGVLTVMNMKIMIFGDVMPSRFVDTQTHCLRFEGSRMEIKGSSKIWLPIYQTYGIKSQKTSRMNVSGPFSLL